MPSFNQLLQAIRQEIRETNVHALKAQMAESTLVLIDIRERDEFVDGHIEGSHFIPRGLLEQKIENQVPSTDTHIVVYCASGARSVFAARSLEEMGYARVESLKGGIEAWKQAGLAIRVATSLSQEQMSRYSRHVLIPEIGEEGQLRLLGAKVLLMGAGGLGSPVALYLAAAGVGTIGLIDSDVVDRSNLQRQVVHTDDRVGVSKVESAKVSLNALNPEIEIKCFDTRLTRDNVLEIFGQDWDVVVDGGDNFPTRYLVNDACVLLDIPFVHGSVFRFEGQVTTFVPHDGPCYRCLYPEPPPPEFAPSCQEAGVLGVLPGVIGLLQAIEVIKLVTGVGTTLSGRLLTFDGLNTTFRELRLRADTECLCCGEAAEFAGFGDYDQFCAVSV